MTTRALPYAFTVLLTAAVLGAPAPVAGQGNGNGNGNGRPKAPNGHSSTPAPATAPVQSSTATSSPTTTTSSSPSTTTPIAPAPTVSAPSVTLTSDTPASVNTFRQFGSWIDDASAPTRGEGYTSIAAGHWLMDGVTQTNIPMLSAGLGLSDRVLVSASLPFYRSTYGGTTVSGVDDMYLGAKFNILDPTLTLHEFGLSVGTIVEVLSAGAQDGRVHFALPVSVELRRHPYRVYGSAGYFSRGSLFTGGAIEWTSPSRLVLSGALTQSYSAKTDVILDQMQVGRQRMDVMGSAAYPLGAHAVTYGSVGRSLVSVQNGATRLAVSGGVSIRFQMTPSAP